MPSAIPDTNIPIALLSKVATPAKGKKLLKYVYNKFFTSYQLLLLLNTT